MFGHLIIDLRRRAPGALLTLSTSLTLIMSSGACGDDGGGPPAVSFQVRESVEQLHITHATPGVTLEVMDSQEAVVATGTADEQGSLVFRLLAPGSGYSVRTADQSEVVTDLTVMSIESSQPDPSFYSDQVLQPGFNYIETRDGTLLSAYVQLPGPVEEGPYPTLVNYSGYEPSRPGEPLEGIPTSLCNLYPVLCDAPTHPSGIIGGVLGFATVGVNMRGTGCSGGAYDFFEPLQLLDGYDIIETVAAQPWVKNNKVGMAGLSYPGISQLFVSSTRPPSLAAITPLSVISDVQSTLSPGGILNNGFAINWSQRVLDSADPYGQGWEQGMVDAGDLVCQENQLLHSQKVDIIQKAYDNPFYDPVVADPINLNLKVPDIDVPVFLAGAWQDEQTGPGFAALLDKFDSSPLTRFTVYNGVHPDGYSPQVLVEWNNFLSFYVKEELPVFDDTLRALVPQFFADQFGAPIEVPPTRFEGYTDFATAKADYEAEPRLRAIFESGAAEGEEVGAPVGAWETTFTEWPPAETVATRWYMQPDGSLADTPPVEVDAASTYTHDPDEGQKLALVPGGDIWALLPEFDWTPHDASRAVVFESAPLAEDLVMLGHGSVDLWIQSTTDDADLEVTLSEVRPDGKEMYVQSGWQRASLRALAADATELRPTKTLLLADAQPLPAGQWELVRVELFAFGHPFRAGSRIRISIDTPGNSRAEWRFLLGEYPADTEIRIAHSADYPSSIALPVIPGVAVPTPLPPCPSLRGQACRDHLPYQNTPAQ